MQLNLVQGSQPETTRLVLALGNKLRVAEHVKLCRMSKAVIFSCVLPPSSYLWTPWHAGGARNCQVRVSTAIRTMFLREVMKQTTAPPTQ